MESLPSGGYQYKSESELDWEIQLPNSINVWPNKSSLAYALTCGGASMHEGAVCMANTRPVIAI